jgi:hypothetical protein
MMNQASTMRNHASYRKQSDAYRRCKEKAGYTWQNRAGRTMRHNARHSMRRHDMARHDMARQGIGSHGMVWPNARQGEAR